MRDDRSLNDREKMEEMNVTAETRDTCEKFDDSVEGCKKGEMESLQLEENKLREIISNEFQGHMKDMRQEISELLDNRMINMVSDILQRMEKVTTNDSKEIIDAAKYCNRSKPAKQDTLPMKQFLQRNSLLTDLYEIKHIRAMYNLIVATLIFLFIHAAIYDIRTTGSPDFAIGTIRRGFGKFPMVLYVWTLMTLSTCGVYVAFCYWATRREQWSPTSFKRKLWDYTWLTSFIIYQILFMVFPTKSVLKEDLPIASSMIVLMEQTRMVMKSHAFVRTLAPRFLAFKPHSDMSPVKPPGFSKFLYFFFAPTLIYRDSYPRAQKIRWNVVLVNFTEVLAIIIFVAILYQRLLQPTFEDFGTKPVEWGMLALNIISSITPGIIMFICGFYLLLHSWMNAFAELLRFADKMFYKDWWNSICYSTYYRTWNIVVHDWLYTFIYKDMYEIVTRRNKLLSTITVFMISAIVHEYILSFTFRFFYPVLMCLFGGIGIFILLVLRSSGNIFLWFSLLLGNGVIASLYCMEYFARLNCPPYRDDFLDYLIPRTWTYILQ
ncbi:sterol O-acyltransferase 1 [Nomia melanderi]|uniref:sterol O-acyltransferase 1 n=1 Tax=Nomia melanderi TaxID=2448451 RepID=UPI0013044568|nr:sterol O-acyltransferase 1 [Nomia melanderi]